MIPNVKPPRVSPLFLGHIKVRPWGLELNFLFSEVEDNQLNNTHIGGPAHI